MTKCNIDNLTLGEIKEISRLAAGVSGGAVTNAPHPFIGKYCIVRAYSAGVHAGEVMSVDGENVLLKDSRRLWSWKAVDGLALSGVAQNGIKSDSKVDVVNPLHYITGVCELIPTTEKARESIHAKK